MAECAEETYVNAGKQEQWPKPANQSGISIGGKPVVNTCCFKSKLQVNEAPVNSFSKAHTGFKQGKETIHFGCVQHKNLFISAPPDSKGVSSKARNKIKTTNSSLLIHRTGESCFPNSAEAAAEGRQKVFWGRRSNIAEISNTNIRTASASHPLPAGKAAALPPRHRGR